MTQTSKPGSAPLAEGAEGAENGDNGEATPALHLVRWTVTSGSNVQSRGAVVIAAAGHQWEGAAEGNGPVDALYRAVDRAVADVLSGQPRLMGYDVHALAEGPDSEGMVKVRIAPPSSAAGRRGTGHYTGHAQSPNIIAASVEAYIIALNQLLAEDHWAGAPEEAGGRRRARHHGAHVAGRAELDEDAADVDVTSWFER